MATIHSRKAWGAKTPKPRTPQNVKAVRELFVHWPGGIPATWQSVNTAAEERQTMRNIQSFHMGPERGWSDFAYNFAIFQSGRIYRGRGMDWVPAAQAGHNTNTTAVVVFIGPEDRPSSAVLVALKSLRHHCERRAGHRLAVRPHGAVTSTECPGPRLRAFVSDL
ncbi:MAG: hypothetical protein H0U19_15060 [Acidobacteria bacterium]|nr:hypothetical protein [Acidobacteriota bacterium]